MAKTSQVPFFVRLGNVLTMTLLRAGFKLVGPYMVRGNYPLYLFTVRGRKSGLPRTIPIVIIERNGKRYLASPYGIVDWVRNLRAAGEAILTRERRAETVNARELPKGEAALVLRADIKHNPFARYFGVTADHSLEEFDRAAISHPVRGVGTVGSVYAVMVAIFGVTQQMILVGDLHWLVETTHLVVGFGALALIGAIGERFTRRKAAVVAVSTTSEAA